MTGTDDILKEFLIESYENLDRLDRELLLLESPGDHGNTLSSIFRSIHTIKGTSGFFGLGKLEAVAHVGENLLSKLRDGKLSVTPEIISGLLALVDAVRGILGRVEATGAEGEPTFGPLIETLTRLKDGSAAVTPATVPAPTPATPATVEETVTDAPKVFATAEFLTAEAAATAEGVGPAGAGEAAPATAVPVVAPHDDHGADGAGKAAAVADTTIRVDVALLDKLMNLVGELVLARNQLLQHTADGGDPNLASAGQRLNLITTELQEGVMKTRMQPIGNIFSKFPRVVRDLAVLCSKKIRVEMDGEGTELDKTIIEAIKDPLTHVVRNSADHGIERPEVREAAGKPPEGVLTLRAYHEGGQVNIEIADDGGGIPVDKVKAKALKLGLITAEAVAKMSDREAVALIFLPGFSTAEQITNVSGRGVGMDVVKTNIERIGGTVDVQSVRGKGTTLRIRIPLTLAIIPALVVTAGGDRYAIPQVSLAELVRLDGAEALAKVESVHGAAVYRLRGKLLPLVRLTAALGLEESAVAGCGTAVPAARVGEAVNIVVLNADDRQFGLLVDEVNDTEEIVVKPLSAQLKGVSAYAGATIMGDGRVALILDAMGLAQRAHVAGDGRGASAHAATAAADKADAAAAAADGPARQTLLLLSADGGRRVAIPLSAVARLEEFARSAVERAGADDVVQYRGEVMPLVYVSDALAGRPGRRPAATPDAGVVGNLQAVVYTAGGRRIGLVVDRILDIVDEAVVAQPTGAGPGIFGTAAIGGRVTELLDLPGLIRSARGEGGTGISARGEPSPPRALAA
jgi:two-component system chemotaxis sensor kinase CheA